MGGGTPWRVQVSEKKTTKKNKENQPGVTDAQSVKGNQSKEPLEI